MPEQRLVNDGQGSLISARELLVFQLAGSLRQAGYRVYGDAREGKEPDREVTNNTLVLAFTRDVWDKRNSFLRTLFTGHRKELLIGRASIHLGILEPGVTVYVQVYGRENLQEITLWTEQFAQEHSRKLKVSLATEDVQLQEFPCSRLHPAAQSPRSAPMPLQPADPVTGVHLKPSLALTK